MISATKNRALLGIVWAIIKTVFKLVYGILKFFNLHLAFLVAIAGVVLFFTGALKNSVVLTVFYVAVIFSIVYAIFTTIKKLLGFGGKKVSKSKGVQIVDEEKSSSGDDEEDQDITDYPKYYKVKQNPAYVMAEFKDRYELYLKTKDGLKLVRTDYKRN